MALNIRSLQKRVLAVEEALTETMEPLTVRIDAIAPGGFRRRLCGPDDAMCRVRLNFVQPAEEAPQLTERERRLIGQQQRATARGGMDRG